VVAEHEIAAPRLEQAERVDPERTVPSQRLGPVRRLDRDPAGTVDRDVERVAGLDERPRRRIETEAARDAVHPARVAGPLHRQRREAREIGSKTVRRGVGEVVRDERLRLHQLLRPGHRNIDQAIHRAPPSAGFAQRRLMIACVTWSAVEITCAFAWKLRCAVIMLTSCFVRSTFDDSSAPDWISPKLAVPGAPRTASPDMNVSAHEVSPSWRRPCRFVKFDSAIWPSACDRPFV